MIFDGFSPLIRTDPPCKIVGVWHVVFVADSIRLDETHGGLEVPKIPLDPRQNGKHIPA